MERAHVSRSMLVQDAMAAWREHLLQQEQARQLELAREALLAAGGDDASEPEYEYELGADGKLLPLPGRVNDEDDGTADSSRRSSDFELSDDDSVASGTLPASTCGF